MTVPVDQAQNNIRNAIVLLKGMMWVADDAHSPFYCACCGVPKESDRHTVWCELHRAIEILENFQC